MTYNDYEFSVPSEKRIRVITNTDAKNEAVITAGNMLGEKRMVRKKDPQRRPTYKSNQAISTPIVTLKNAETTPR